MEANAKENEIDWNNIFILNEFLTYIRPCDLKDFSLLSGLVINKLKPKLFIKITLSSKNIIKRLNSRTFKDEGLAKISDYFEYWENCYYYDRFEEKWKSQLSNNSGLLVLNQLLEEELEKIGNFIKTFSVNGFDNSFYFISLVTFNLINLTRLNLEACSFPLLTILRIGEHLKKLKNLNLYTVSFVELTKQELSPKDVYLPCNLEELSIEHCAVYRMYSVPNTLSLVQYFCNNIEDDPINLQGFKFPRLKKLSLDLVHDKQFVLKLLKSNPLVKELKISGYNNMTQDVSDLISTSHNLKNITIYSNERFPYITDEINLVIPKFNYINVLKLQFRPTNDLNFYHHQSIINYFPNLTQLALDIADIDFDYFNLNAFIRVNLSSINKLDILILELKNVDDFYYEDNIEIFDKFKFDWSNFINLN
ncbi:hypothetical protein CONCODRAFT_12942, partial [Conidiobolus coronatus NRRL 28638]